MTPAKASPKPVNGSQLHGWLSEFWEKRRANATNVFIAETFDLKRLDQFLNIARSGNLRLKKGNPTVIDFDMQRGKARKVEPFKTDDSKEKGGFSDVEIRGDPIGFFDERMRAEITWTIFRYAARPSHAEILADPLLSWSHDDRLYSLGSTAIVFTADAGLFDERLRRLFHTIQIPPSTEEERSRVIGSQMDLFKQAQPELNFKADPKTISNVAKASAGLTLHDVETSTLESIFSQRALKPEAFVARKIAILRDYGIRYVQPERGFESVGGYETLKTYIRERIIKVLADPTKAGKYGLRPPRGLLFIGPPGTGKTYLSKALAVEIGLAMLSLGPEDFLKGVVGESEARVRQLTMLIESLSPCVCFIDEFDKLAMRREAVMSTDSGVSRRVSNGILEWMGDEKRRSIIVGATNFLDLDQAFLRPGRIDEVLLILPPDRQARGQILKIRTAGMPVDEDVDFDEIAMLTRGWTGAELESMVYDAAGIAFANDLPTLSHRVFVEATQNRSIDLAGRNEQVKRMVSEMKRLDNVNQKFLAQSVKQWEDMEIKGRDASAAEELSVPTIRSL